MERLPEWLHARHSKKEVDEIAQMMEELGLHTVCKEAACPNMGECYKKHTATFMILGAHCTRHCRFCNVSKDCATPVDINEPDNVASAAKKLNLHHVVVTSVTRDDLPDGGAEQFALTTKAIRRELPEAAVELLVPDFQGNTAAADTVLKAKPDIYAHNIETVPRLYPTVRPEANYKRSLDVLEYAKKNYPDIVTKSGIMVGLGETVDEVSALMDDVVRIGCEIFTIGQYLRPSKLHHEVLEYVTPEKFDMYAELGKSKGIKYVFSAPFVRSSYHAKEAFDEVKK